MDLKRDKFSVEIRRVFRRFLTCWEWNGCGKSVERWWDYAL